MVSFDLSCKSGRIIYLHKFFLIFQVLNFKPTDAVHTQLILGTYVLQIHKVAYS